MINTPSAIQLGQSKNPCRLPCSLSSHFTTSSTCADTLPLLLSVSSCHLHPHCTAHAEKLFADRAKMLLIIHTRRVVALNYSLNRHTEYIQQIIYIYIYEKSTVQLASVGLVQAHPNNIWKQSNDCMSIKQCFLSVC